MNKIAVLLGATLFLSACSKTAPTKMTQVAPGDMQPKTTETAPVAQASPISTSVMTIPLSEQNKSGQSGLAILEEVNGKIQVTINLMGQPADSSQPAHFHTGTCAKPGEVTFPLTAVVNGKSVTLLETTLDAIKKGSTILNVHKSAKESTVYEACGELVTPVGSGAPLPPGIKN